VRVCRNATSGRVHRGRGDSGHHIEPFRRVHQRRFENPIPLCPNYHRKADRGEIASWVLTQLKRTLKFRNERPVFRKSTITALPLSYEGERGAVAGEGYYTAAAFLDWVRSQRMTTRVVRAFLAEILPGTPHTDLVLSSFYLEVDRCDDAVRVLEQSPLRNSRDLKYIGVRALAADRAGDYRAATIALGFGGSCYRDARRSRRRR
jgi:hypothetical protein